MRTRDGALYAGVATDVPRRFAEHVAGRGSRYLRGRGPLTLAWSRRLGDHSLALRVELRLKRLPKASKERIAAARPTRRSLLRELGLA